MSLAPFGQTVAAGVTTRPIDQFPLYATQYLRSDGGRFVTLDTGTGTYKLSLAASTQLDGWVDICIDINGSGNPSAATPFISSSTNGGDVVAGTKEIYGTKYGFWMPVKTGQTVATSMLDQQYDLAIEGSTTTTKQVVDTGATSTKVVKVLAIDTRYNSVCVCAVQK